MSEVTLPQSIAANLTDFWSPKIIAAVDDSYVKVAKLKGSLVTHVHGEEDELFYVLKGRLRLEMPEETVELAEGELYVVPKGVAHNPIAEEECHVLLIEKKSTQHTGNVVIPETKSIQQQLSENCGKF